jgi:hypothetical protein
MKKRLNSRTAALAVALTVASSIGGTVLVGSAGTARAGGGEWNGQLAGSGNWSGHKADGGGSWSGQGAA